MGSSAAAKVHEHHLEKPPRGMIKVDGKYQIRWAGFVTQRELTCYNHHRIHTKPGERPIENSIPCGYREPPGHKPCTARLYVFRTRARLLFAMDITEEEDTAIELAEMDLDDIIEFFGLSFPARVRR